MEDAQITVTYGRIKIVTTQRVEGNKFVFGSYAIHYDENGREIRRTEDTPTCSCTFA